MTPSLGKLLWRAAYPAPYKVNPAADRHGAGPKSTPVVYQGKVFTLGIGGVLSSFDAATGKPGWRKNFSGEFRETSPWYGTAASPVVDGGMVIAHVGGHDDGALMAFDAATGAVKWKWKGDGPGYASPIVVELAGKRQVVTQTQQNIVGVAAATGELLWKIPFHHGIHAECRYAIALRRYAHFLRPVQWHPSDSRDHQGNRLAQQRDVDVYARASVADARMFALAAQLPEQVRARAGARAGVEP